MLDNDDAAVDLSIFLFENFSTLSNFSIPEFTKFSFFLNNV